MLSTLRSRQVKCSTVSISACCWTSVHSARLLMRAEARGLSGILMASMPAALRNLAPSTSLLKSMPLGGTISTRVTNSPVASLRPRFDRCASGGGATVATRLRSLTVVKLLVLPFTSAIRRPAFIDLMCSGVVPQQPPIRPTPAAGNFCVGLRRQRLGGLATDALNGFQHGHRANAAIAANHVRAPFFNLSDKRFRAGAIQAVAIFINSYLGHNLRLWRDFPRSQNRLVQFFQVAKS